MTCRHKHCVNSTNNAESLFIIQTIKFNRLIGFMNNLSIRHLRAFREVAQYGSFTQAASRLHLTQSTLTATIKQLESQAGLQLFDRTTRRVFLTAEGEKFLPVAEKLISDFDTAFNDLQATVSQLQGKVGIAASPSIISRILPSVIKEYHQHYPAIGLYLRDDSAGGLEQRVLDNDVDFALGGNHSNHPELEYFPVLEDQYGAVFQADHPLNLHQQLIWNQILDLPKIQLTADTGTRSQLTTVLNEVSRLEKNHLKPEEVLIEVSTPAGLAEMVKNGIGIALLPALAASTVAFTDLHFTPLTEPVLVRTLYVIRRKGRSISPAADSLLQLILSSFNDNNLPPFVKTII